MSGFLLEVLVWIHFLRGFSFRDPRKVGPDGHSVQNRLEIELKPLILNDLGRTQILVPVWTSNRRKPLRRNDLGPPVRAGPTPTKMSGPLVG